MPVYLRINNPLDAEKPFPTDLLAALKKASKYERNKNDFNTQWTKEYPLKSWVNDIESGDEYWTTHIPSKALPIIKQFGYDGIKERGLKNSTAPHEERQINWIAFDPEQVKSSLNKGTFSESNPKLQYSPSGETSKPPEDAPMWFSQLRRTVESNKIPEKAPAAQVAAVLRNPQNGVKADELKWTGLDDFLKEKLAKGEKVTKAEVLQFLDTNNVRVEEVVKGGGTPEDALIAAWWNKQSGSAMRWDNLTANAQAQARERYAEEQGTELSELGGQATKFQNYQLPGGENYREILFRLPEMKSEAFGLWKDYANTLREKYGEGYYPSKLTQYEKQRLEALHREAGNGSGAVFKSSHWEEPNVLAHVRVNDRIDSDGKPVLFAEELQSDWHQLGRKEGYKQQGIYKIVSKDERSGRITEYRSKSEAEADWAAMENRGYNLANEKIKFYPDQSTGTIPDAPFKNTWHEMVLRRLVRMAAEEGKDKLAWTTGEQQAERYDLSKQVSAIDAVRNSDGTYGINAQTREGTQNVGDNIPYNKLSDYVGKDLAEKILKNEGSREVGEPENYQSFTGPDLKIGGKGMKGFYDKILVDYANKFGKKFGAKVEDIELPLQEAPSEKYPNPKVHALDITPEMKKSVLAEGQPLFSPESKEEKSKEGEKQNDKINEKRVRGSQPRRVNPIGRPVSEQEAGSETAPAGRIFQKPSLPSREKVAA